MADPPVRLLNFVSENELEEGREKGVVPRDDLQSFPDRALFEILKENKDKKDAEFNELLKHRPPKALDEDETEFLDSLEMVSMCIRSSKSRSLPRRKPVNLLASMQQ
jgi:aconitase B